MSLKSLQPRTTALIILILLAAGFRLVQSSPVFSILSNVTPIGAIALFGGAYFTDKWKAFLVPILVLWITDIFLNRMYYYDHWTFFHSGMLWIYASFALMVALGMFMKRITFFSVITTAIGAAFLHWLVSDFGVWISGSIDITTGLPFTRDFSGFIKCLYLALPFLKNMAIGNLLFSGVLFGSFEWIQLKYPSLRVADN